MPSTESILDRQLRRWEIERQLGRAHPEPTQPRTDFQPVITVSRQRGSGGTLLAAKLAERFDYALLHRDIIDRICSTTGYQRRILESLDEHARSEVVLWVESLIAGRSMDRADYVRALLETVSSMARLGGVVVVGRGANFIVGPGGGFHLRVVAPRAARVRNLAAREKMSERQAGHLVDTADRDRREFVRQVCNRDIDDPHGYDLVINLDGIGMETALGLAATAALDKFERLRTTAP